MAQIQVVWFKRDLRAHDHEPLWRATRAGPVVGLYVLEPSLWARPEYHAPDLELIRDSVEELRARLGEHAIEVLVRVGELPEMLDRLHAQLPFGGLWSHEETGNGRTWARDRRVKRWCRHSEVRWHELAQPGIRRPNPGRQRWAASWRAAMRAERAPRLRGRQRWSLPKDISPDEVPGAEALRLAPTQKDAQPGGEGAGLELLDSFLQRRSRTYRESMSSPVEGWEACSRLSPHFALGSVSPRQAYQRTIARVEELRARGEVGWAQQLKSFESRLAWRAHFMQRLEDEPALEHRNVNRAFDGMRQEDQASWPTQLRRRLEAWRVGRTGFPMVDAAMRALRQTGWLNFRMRAMLVSFASYQLWLHWRPTALHLGRHFLDFEPGIHFNQLQMQSGVTGINAVRAYSPYKQALEQDPRGEFIRRWVPELARVQHPYLYQPHKMPPSAQYASGCRIDRDYPSPIVPEREARARAIERVFAIRRSEHARQESRRVYQRHGSRARRGHRRSRREEPGERNLELFSGQERG